MALWSFAPGPSTRRPDGARHLAGASDPGPGPAYLTPSSTSVDRERAMGERRARDDEVARWREHGWVLLEGLVPAREIDPAVDDLYLRFPRPEESLADPEGETERRLGRPPRSRRVSVATGRAPAAALCLDLAHLQEESGRGPGRDASETPSRFSTWILSKPKARSDSRRAGEPARSTKAISS